MKSPAFSFYVRDWLCSKTVSKLHSKPCSKGVGAYLYLLCSAWLEDPPATLPNDDASLAGYARVSPEEWSVLKPDLMVQFTLNSQGRLVNQRLMEEWLKQEKRKQSGSLGGLAKAVANTQANRVAALEDENEVENGTSIPSVEEAISCTMAVGIDPKFCRYVYDDWATRGGKDGANVIVKWLPYVTKRWSREKVDWSNGTHKGNGNKTHQRSPAENPRNANTHASVTTDYAGAAKRATARLEQKMAADRNAKQLGSVET